MNKLSEEEILDKLRKMLFHTQKANECGLSNNDFKEDIEALSGILDLYQKEKEKNKKYENKIKAVLELIDTKPYTAYTLYGDILYDDENIRELLEKEG